MVVNHLTIIVRHFTQTATHFNCLISHQNIKFYEALFSAIHVTRFPLTTDLHLFAIAEMHVPACGLQKNKAKSCF